MAAALAVQVGPRPARTRPGLRLASSAAGRLSQRARAHPRADRWAGTISTAVTDEEVLTYACDPSDRLVGVARDAEPVAPTTDAGTTNYLWDEQNLLAELEGASEAGGGLATLAQYTDYPGVWGGLSSVHAGGASAFFAPDLSSNIRLLLNAAQGVEQASLYGAFGVPLAGATASPLGFGGGLGYFDDGLDRLYVRARHYRPGLGAWMSRDPLGGLLGGYGYVGNSPVGWVDPSGLYVDGPVGQEGRDLVYDAMSVKEAAQGVGQAVWNTIPAAGNAEDAYGVVAATFKSEVKAHGRWQDKRAATSDRVQHARRAAQSGWQTRAEQDLDRLVGDSSRMERRPALDQRLRKMQELKVAGQKAILARGCPQAATTAAERAALGGRLGPFAEWLKELVNKVRFGLVRFSEVVDAILEKFKWIDKAFGFIGLASAIHDIVEGRRQHDACMKKGSRCTDRVCSVPVGNAIVDALMSGLGLIALYTAALAPVVSGVLGAISLVGGLGTTVFGYGWRWWYAECFR